jgi:hypothetical protein
VGLSLTLKLQSEQRMAMNNWSRELMGEENGLRVEIEAAVHGKLQWLMLCVESRAYDVHVAICRCGNPGTYDGVLRGRLGRLLSLKQFVDPVKASFLLFMLALRRHDVVITGMLERMNLEELNGVSHKTWKSSN